MLWVSISSTVSFHIVKLQNKHSPKKQQLNTVELERDVVDVESDDGK